MRGSVAHRGEEGKKVDGKDGAMTRSIGGQIVA